jgi:hypothetical protein
MPSSSSALSLLVMVALSACNAMAIPCLATKGRPDLVGHWRFVGRPPGFDPDVSDRLRPHPDTLDLLGDGRWEMGFSGSQLERLRELYPRMGHATTQTGSWKVGRFCPGDLFLPTQCLRFYPGPWVRHFELEDDHLTIFYPFGSGCCHETYERARDAPIASPGALPLR